MPDAAPQAGVLRLRNQLEELERLQVFVSQYCAARGLSADDTFAITLALDELVTNVILHGYEDQAAHEIQVTLSRDADTVVVDLEDDARPFDPSQPVTVDTSAALQEREIGGLGLHLVQRTMDQLTYRRAAGRNHLRLRKQLAPR